MTIKSFLKQAGIKAADGIAKLSVLSPEQLKQVDQKREAYLNEMPDYSNESVQEDILKRLAVNGIEIYQDYLKHLDSLYLPVSKTAEYDEPFDTQRNTRIFRITKWVQDEKEDPLDKLISVYQVLSKENCNVSLIFNRKMNHTDVYLAVTNLNNSDAVSEINSLSKRIESALHGQFPGAEFEKSSIPSFLKPDIPWSVASVSNMPSDKSEKFRLQTIERLLDGIVPRNRSEEYTVILMASPIHDIEERKLQLSEAYSELSPFSDWSTSFQLTESDSNNSMAIFGVNAGVGTSANIGQAKTDGSNRSVTDSNSQAYGQNSSHSNTDSTSHSLGRNESTGIGTSSSISQSNSNSHSNGSNSGSSDTLGINASRSVTAGGSAGVPGAASVNASVSDTIGGHYDHSWSRGTSQSDSVSQSLSRTLGRNTTETIGRSLTDTAGRAVSQSIGNSVTNSLGQAVSRGINQARTMNLGGALSANFGANFARSSNVSATVGKNEGFNKNYTNYSVKRSLKHLDEQMDRLDQISALGGWDFTAFFVSEDQTIVNNAAHSYLALTQGEKSYLSPGALNIWRGKHPDSKDQAKEIVGYLRDLRQPLFGLSPDAVNLDPTLQTYPTLVNAAVCLNGKELARALNFPNRSIAGLPVIDTVSFGRNVLFSDLSPESETTVRLGCVRHMDHDELTEVGLSLNSLASHTFVTGSTGSGKSNAIYKLLSEARDNGIPFLVIEPAKGEYKDQFGMLPDVTVYSSNPEQASLLKLNPFSFPKEVHILEHLDRLTEIFNACWPMYAAMPAVLKKAIEKAYEDCGWDLLTSKNRYDFNFTPTVADVIENVRTIINSSEYDAENKGAYKGALLTRLESLKTGLTGQMISQDEIPESDLFDQNVIIDLSRIGSSETRSLLMGLLVLKLQEYRMSQKAGNNQPLKHLTVLEEAHQLLMKSSPESSQESANIQGRSVEMIANSIAEMRTFGEGFIIADQAPGLLDPAVIRNTNTKIIMRLPESGDRYLCGKASGLDDEQTEYLQKLSRGIAAVYQNNWLEPVLCHIDYVPASDDPYSWDFNVEDIQFEKIEDRINLTRMLVQRSLLLSEEAFVNLYHKLRRLNLPGSVQVQILERIQDCKTKPDSELRDLLAIIYSDQLELNRFRIEKILKDTKNAAAKLTVQEKIRTELKKGMDQNGIFIDPSDQVIQKMIIEALISVLRFSDNSSGITDIREKRG